MDGGQGVCVCVCVMICKCFDIVVAFEKLKASFGGVMAHRS